MKSLFRLFISAIVAVLCLSTAPGYADREKWERDGQRQHRSSEFRVEKHFNERNVYPREGYRVRVLPHRHRAIHYHNHDYFYFGGIWYQPSGADFIVIRPPLGIVVSVLPPIYNTLWIGDVPYYFANGVYYHWRDDLNGYEVVELPESEIKPSESSYKLEKIFIYPKNGQNEKQQADDQYACHQYGVEQTNYDPSQPPANDNVNALQQKRKDYQDAMKSCLQGKGYSVH